MTFLSNGAYRLAWTLLLSTMPLCRAQSAISPSSNPQADQVKSGRPLPDIATLMHQVEANQQASESAIHNYIYTSTIVFQKLDGHGDAKKTETIERDVFYIDSVRLERMTRKDGKDLSADEKRKEADRIDKEIAKAKQKRAGDAAKPLARQETVTFARFLELGSFSNERRTLLRGRSAIALDYVGDPKAKTRSALEGVIHDMAGTVWIDEQQSALSRVEGHFVESFKVAGGLVFSVAKDTAFTADWTPVNGEVWLPSAFVANGSLRALLFVGFNGRVSGTSTNYRRFKTNSTILPGVQEVKGEPAPPTSLPAVH